MEDTQVLTAANNAIGAAEKVSEKADKVLAKAEASSAKIDAAFGPNWEKEWADVVQLAKDHKDGKVSTPKETIIGLIKHVNDEMHADLKERGLMFGGKHASSEVEKITDTWDRKFDYQSFMFQTRKVEVASMKQSDVLDIAMQSLPRNELQRQFQHAYMDLMIADAIGRAKGGVNYQRRGFRETFPKLTAICDYYRSHMWADITQKAALDPNDVADTALWVPTVFAPDFRELLWLETRCESMFDMITYPGPGNVWRMPLDLTDYVGDYVPDTLAMTYALSNPFSANDPIQLGKPHRRQEGLHLPDAPRSRHLDGEPGRGFGYFAPRARAREYSPRNRQGGGNRDHQRAEVRSDRHGSGDLRRA